MSYFRLLVRRRLRATMRGYALLKREHRIGELRKIKNSLVDCPIPNVQDSASVLIFGTATSQAEVIVRQFLLERYGGNSLVRRVLNGFGRRSIQGIYPVPAVWRNQLIVQSMLVNEVGSTILWGLITLMRLGQGISTILAITLVALVRSKKIEPTVYAYFDGVTLGNLPTNQGQSFDVCTWYSRLSLRDPTIKKFRHSIPRTPIKCVDGIEIESTPQPFFLLHGVRRTLSFLAWGICACGLSLVDVILGRWWSAVMLSEAAKAKAVALCPSEILAKEYLFPFSGTIYRPLWTYEAEYKGASVTSYFYSTFDQPKLSMGYVSQKFEWGPTSWPRFLVWDDYQKTALQRDLGRSLNAIIVGPIYFSDSQLPIPVFPSRSVAVFDIEPHRASSHFGFSTRAEYMVECKHIDVRFLQDISIVATKLQATMVCKGKRDIGSRADRFYMATKSHLERSKATVFVDPGISAMRVVQACAAVISAPFTSTALYGKQCGIPSAFYDPSGWILEDDLGSHGLPILRGIDELEKWLFLALYDKVYT